jgi:pimeloyl-ACP methyl ester carboxylesterase
MMERALRFGHTTPLVGILTQPAGGEARSDAPAVLILNSGIIHHIGANRLYVEIARELARLGFSSLRFDFSGVGDSEPRRDALPFEESAVVEAREAMDFVAEVTGATEFVLIGLCSGADMSYYTALEDERVVGLAQLDAFVYRTGRWYVKRYVPKVLDLGAWVNAVRCRIEPLLGKVTGGAEDDTSEVFVAPEYRRVFPPKETVEDGMRRLAHRGLEFFFTFTGDEENILYRDQYEEAMDVEFGERIEVRYMPESDHTFTGLVHQRSVVRAVTAWCSARWPGQLAGRNSGSLSANPHMKGGSPPQART